MAYLLTLLQLSGETTVPVSLLSESEELLSLIKEGKTLNELIAFINENW